MKYIRKVGNFAYGVTTSSKNITPFGGLNLIYNTIIKAGIPDFLNNKIGYRSDFTKYSYSNIVLSLFENALCNGSYLSDLK